jgi:tetratricopeptide (TPR) repeat protein
MLASSARRRATWRSSVAFLLVAALAPQLAPVPARAQLPFATEPPPPGACTEGARLIRAEQYEQAITALKACLEGQGERVDVLVSLTAASLYTEDPEAAQRYGERAVTLAPDDADARYWYGRALLRAGDMDAAVKQWEAGLHVSTTHVGLLEGLAKVALDRGQFEKAYGLLSQLRLQGQDAAWVHRLLADLTRRKGLWKESLGHWQDALERSEPTAEDLLVASELSILAERLDDAVAYARQAVALDPSGATYSGLGQALFSADRPDSAIAAMRRAIELAPDEPRHRFQLANALELLGRSDEAESYFAGYVAARPEDPMGRLNYAIHLDRSGEQLEALEQVRRAVALDTTTVRARVLEAQILERLGRYEEALAVVEYLADHGNDEVTGIDDWLRRLRKDNAAAKASESAGKVRLLHIVLADSSQVAEVESALAAGADFADLATQYSVGPSAVQGGDVGWIAPTEMVEPLRSAIVRLEPQEVTPPIAMRGYVHIFKRLR